MNIIDNFIKAINEGHYPTVLESYVDTAPEARIPQIPGVLRKKKTLKKKTSILYCQFLMEHEKKH